MTFALGAMPGPTRNELVSVEELYVPAYVEPLARTPNPAAEPATCDRSDPSTHEGATRATQVRTLAQGPETWGEFKTPSLRTVALSPPYMHQGQMASLRDVVEHYSTQATAVEPADPSHVEAPRPLVHGRLTLGLPDDSR